MRNYFCLLIAMAFMSSCMKVIDIRIPENERKIVINAVVYPDSVFSANISISRHVLDESRTLDNLDNAKVRIYHDNLFVEELECKESGLYRGKIRAEIGKSYTFEVENSPYMKASGTIKTLEAMAIDSIISKGKGTLLINNYGMEEQEEFQLYQLYFRDKLNEENFYRIRIRSVPKASHDTVVFDAYENDSVRYTISPAFPAIGSNDIANKGNEVNNYYYFSDINFNGKTYGYNFGISIPDEAQNQYIKVYLEQISEAYFNYANAYNSEGSNLSYVFSQPVQVYDNIENGFGILGTSTVSLDSVWYEP